MASLWNHRSGTDHSRSNHGHAADMPRPKPIRTISEPLLDMSPYHAARRRLGMSPYHGDRLFPHSARRFPLRVIYKRSEG